MTDLKNKLIFTLIKHENILAWLDVVLDLLLPKCQ